MDSTSSFFWDELNAKFPHLVRYNNEIAWQVWGEFYIVSLTFDYYVIFNVVMEQSIAKMAFFHICNNNIVHAYLLKVGFPKQESWLAHVLTNVLFFCCNLTFFLRSWFDGLVCL